MGGNKYPLTGIRFTPEDKERIAFISKHTDHKIATAGIHVAYWYVNIASLGIFYVAIHVIAIHLVSGINQVVPNCPLASRGFPDFCVYCVCCCHWSLDYPTGDTQNTPTGLSPGTQPFGVQLVGCKMIAPMDSLDASGVV